MRKPCSSIPFFHSPGSGWQSLPFKSTYSYQKSACKYCPLASGVVLSVRCTPGWSRAKGEMLFPLRWLRWFEDREMFLSLRWWFDELLQQLCYSSFCRQHLFPPKLVSRLKQQAFAIYNMWLSGYYFEYSCEDIGMESLKDRTQDGVLIGVHNALPWCNIKPRVTLEPKVGMNRYPMTWVFRINPPQFSVGSRATLFWGRSKAWTPLMCRTLGYSSQNY